MSPFTLIFIFFAFVVVTCVLARIMKSVVALFIVILAGWFVWGLLSPKVIEKVEMTTPVVEERIEQEKEKVDATIEKASSGSSIIRGIKSVFSSFFSEEEASSGTTLDVEATQE